jgi:hypothetical protein
MRAKQFTNLAIPKSELSDEVKQKRLAQAHAAALKIDASLEEKKAALLMRKGVAFQSKAERACMKKRKFPTGDAAAIVAAQTLAGGDAPSCLRAYLCRRCGKWHLTSKPLVTTSSTRP